MADGLMLKNCKIVITQNERRDILKDSDILIEDGRIVQIGNNLNSEGLEKMDCSGKIVMPALFNGHTHSAMTLLRGYNDDKELHDWLGDIWQIEARMKPEDMYIGALYACMEMAKTGTYCFADMYFEMEEVARACNKIGLKSFLGYGMLDLHNEEKRENEIQKTINFIKWARGKYPVITPILAPHAIYTCSDELLKWVKEYSRENDLIKTIHISETEKEVLDNIKSSSLRPVEYLEKMGFLDGRTIIFHASWINEAEMDILAKRNVTAIHCPASNMKLATGGAFPLREYIEKKINIGLGTDSAASNNSLDMFLEMKFASLLQKWHRRQAKGANAQEILDMATLNPAKAFGLKSGSIEPLMEANIAILDSRHHSLMPLRSILSNIVYSATGDAVSDLIVAGKFVVRDKKLLNADEEEIKNGFMDAAEKLYSRSS